MGGLIDSLGMLWSDGLGNVTPQGQAAGLGKLGIQTCKVAGDLPSHSLTTPVDAAGLSFPVEARSYIFCFFIAYRSSQLATGMGVTINRPAGTINLWYENQQGLAAAWSNAGNIGSAIRAGTAVAEILQATDAPVIAANLGARVMGACKLSAAGTLQLQYCSENAGESITIKDGSCGILFDLGT